MSAVFDPEQLEAPQLLRHRIGIAEYYRMAETGVLAPDARVELIEGEIIDMATMGSRHWRAVRELNKLLIDAVGNQAEVVCQLPLRISGFSEPVPDFCILRNGTTAALHGDILPDGTAALLVIEVSDSTLSYDARIKAPLYARHGVAEYWIIDVAARCLHRFADAAPGGDWRIRTTQHDPAAVELPGLPGVQVNLAAVF